MEPNADRGAVGIHLCLLRSEGLVLGEVKLNIQH